MDTIQTMVEKVTVLVENIAGLWDTVQRILASNTATLPDNESRPQVQVKDDKILLLLDLRNSSHHDPHKHSKLI
jgi:hypothetical protein